MVVFNKNDWKAESNWGKSVWWDYQEEKGIIIACGKLSTPWRKEND